MNASFPSLPAWANFDFGQFLGFFNQLSNDYKKLILSTLEKQSAPPEPSKPAPWETLKSTVLRFDEPLEPVAELDWEHAL